MRISIITPVRNGETYLAQTLRSALNQTLPPLEMIVVDDGSSDRSLEIAHSFGPPVRTLHGPFGSASAARRAGAERAFGDALMFLDADDLLGPTALEELSAAVVARPEAVACCPWMRFEQIDGCWQAMPPSCAPRRRYHDDLSAWLTGWYHPPCSVLWSRAAYAASGGWDPEVTVNDDGDLMMRALATGVPLVPTIGGTAYYRRHPNGGPSLSGRRFTRPGIESSLKVLDKVARALVQTGQISRYRAPLAEAYDRLAAECPEAFPDLHDRASEAARSHGGSELLRKARERFDRAVAPLRFSRKTKPLPDVARPVPSPDRAEVADEEPTVSVIVPTYNRAQLLARALNGVFAQTYSRFEVLVVDDGSTDGTAEVVRTFQDPRLRYIRQPANAGVSAARNRGLREAKGSLVAFLDSDDEWTPETLERQVEVMQRRPDKVGLVFAGVLEFGAGGDRIIKLPRLRGDVWREMLHHNILTSASGIMIRRHVVDTVGYFDEKLPAIEDYEYWTRIARFYEFDFVPAVLIHYHDEEQDALAAETRRSRNFRANMIARSAFAERFAYDAARVGVRHFFLLESAKRELRSPDGEPRRAMRLLAKAIRSRPAEPRLYMWLLFSLLPWKTRVALSPFLEVVRARLPKRLWFGPA